MSLWLTVALQAAQPDSGVVTFDLAASSKPKDLTVIQRCSDGASSNEIVVCGSRHDQYRLPLPNERQQSDRTQGEAQTGMAALTPSGGAVSSPVRGDATNVKQQNMDTATGATPSPS